MDFTSALLFLINTFFSLAYNLLFARIFLYGTGVSPFNPLVLFIKKLSDPLRKPIAKIIPNIRSFDTSTAVVLLIIAMMKILLLCFLMKNALPNMIIWPLAAVAELIKECASLISMAILLSVLFSWIPALRASTIGDILFYMTEPFFQFAHRFIPPIAGMDLSPIVLMIAIKFLQLGLFDPFYISMIRLI